MPDTAYADRLLVRLADGVVHLEPLDESHREPLRAACAADAEIWDIYPVCFIGEHFDISFDAYLADRDRIMFALFAGGVLVGMSGYLNVAAKHRTLEIGSTYLAPAARGTGLNLRFKTLLIENAFRCGFERIEFRIDTRNPRSMRAVEKLGARHEGTIRKHRITWTGYCRDSAIYGLLAQEWQRG